MIEILILFVAVLFSLNMGAPSFASAFSTAYGSRVLSRVKLGLLFVIFSVLGGVLLGKEVAVTLSKGIISPDVLHYPQVLIILVAATLSLFVANLMHIPQSTSLSTIAAICGVGFFYQDVNWPKIQYLAVCWVSSIVISYIGIHAVTHFVYPPRHSNFWIYERLVNHQDRLKFFIILTGCYTAFAQGTNNIANAVGPLSAAGIIDVHLGLLLMGVLFGLGAFTFSGPLKTSGERIVPLGLLTAAVINLVSGTITIAASKLGVPLPTVIVYTVSIFAIGTIKDGMISTIEKPLTKKTFYSWCINPLITFTVSYALAWAFLGKS